MNGNVSKYDSYSNAHNFFFHPLHRKAEQKGKTALAVITNIFMTVVTGGLWQIPFWIVNRHDYKKYKMLSKEKTEEINKASKSTGTFSSPPNPPQSPRSSGGEGGPDLESTITTPPSSPPPHLPAGGTPSVEEIDEAGLPFKVPSSAFGAAKWKKYFGVVVGKEPALPPEIDTILASNCRIFPGKKVSETHILVLVPEKVDGKPLTLESLGELVKIPKDDSGGHASQYRVFSENITDTCKKETVTSHWVLITKDVIGGPERLIGSRNKSYADQEQMIQQIARDLHIPYTYTVPSARDAAVALFMHHAETGKRLFGDIPITCTRCLERDVDGAPVVVGDFRESGLSVESIDFDLDYYGMAASLLF